MRNKTKMAATTKKKAVKREKVIKVYPGFGDSFNYPRIQLMGKWLLDLGFEVDECICVKASDGRIVIEKASDEQFVNYHQKRKIKDIKSEMNKFGLTPLDLFL